MKELEYEIDFIDLFSSVNFDRSPVNYAKIKALLNLSYTNHKPVLFALCII